MGRMAMVMTGEGARADSEGARRTHAASTSSGAWSENAGGVLEAAELVEDVEEGGAHLLLGVVADGEREEEATEGGRARW